MRFLLYLMRPGLRNKEFTYHGLMEVDIEARTSKTLVL